MTRVCGCRCHDVNRANQRGALALSAYHHAYAAAQQALRDGPPVADASDPVHAALACDDCRPRHCLALLPRHIWGPRIVPRPSPPTFTQADGEGAES